jgi:hypothetical protein
VSWGNLLIDQRRLELHHVPLWAVLHDHGKLVVHRVSWGGLLAVQRHHKLHFMLGRAYLFKRRLELHRVPLWAVLHDHWKLVVHQLRCRDLLVDHGAHHSLRHLRGRYLLVKRRHKLQRVPLWAVLHDHGKCGDLVVHLLRRRDLL